MEPACLLIVDDNPENLTVLGELLQDDYRVRAANAGPVALKLARLAPQPDLILLDVMMPGMSGHEVLQALRSDPATRDIPVIFVTAMNAVEDEAKGLALGAVDYLTKPLSPPIVQARVRTHLELKRTRDLLRNDNLRLEAEVARRMRDNLHIQEASILALASLAETRDNETGNHLRRTQEYVRRLARQVQHHPRFAATLDDCTIDLMAKSAPLHDIGKVGIPDKVLLKPGKLTPAEWTIMQTHARIGADAIERAERDAERPIAFLAYAKEIAGCHHERWNGEGYPNGLAGEAIPVSARLMAVADVFDALISRRVYKEPMPFDQARDIIKAQRGEHFDPVLVDAFLEIYDDFCAIAERFADSQEDVERKNGLLDALNTLEASEQS
ncbi:MAG: two-component system response regulator [Burkholderiales bacterium]